MTRFSGLITAVVVALGLTVGAVACGDDTASTSASDTSSTTKDSSTSTPADDGAPVIDPGDGGDYAPDIDPAKFVATIDNPYLPFPVGARWVYEGEEDGEVERVEVTVLDEQREIMGVTVTVVRDVVTVDGEVVEDTHDWYAQDAEGNVWYFGEDVKNFADGRLEDTDGSWEAGVDGALPGIVMLAEPTVGEAYRQEFYEGEAEDLGEVVRAGESVSVPAGDYDDVIITKDWNPLEPDVIEEKSYAPGIGMVLEEHVQGDGAPVELLEVSGL